MEKKLKALFDFQRFQGNERLTKLIDAAKQSASAELNDEELALVAAAGESIWPNQGDKDDEYK